MDSIDGHAMTPAKSTLTVEQSKSLSALSAGNHPRLAERAQVVLLSAEGHAAVRVAERLGVTVRTVYKWRQRFQVHGLDGLRDRARPGQPRRLSRQSRDEIVRLTVEELPPEGQRWTIRSVAKQLGVTQHQVRKVWSEHSVRPHLGRGALVDERFLGGRGLRLKGLFVGPACAAVALQVDAHGGATARLQRRVLPSGAQWSHRIIRLVSRAEPASVGSDFASFLATMADQVLLAGGHARLDRTSAREPFSDSGADAGGIHLLFSSKHLLVEPRTSQLLAKYPQVGASAKTSVALWADTLELWLEQTQKQGSQEQGIEALRDAMQQFVSSAEKGRPGTAFVWIRQGYVPVRSVGSVSVRSADL